MASSMLDFTRVYHRTRPFTQVLEWNSGVTLMTELSPQAWASSSQSPLLCLGPAFKLQIVPLWKPVTQLIQ